MTRGVGQTGLYNRSTVCSCTVRLWSYGQSVRRKRARERRFRFTAQFLYDIFRYASTTDDSAKQSFFTHERAHIDTPVQKLTTLTLLRVHYECESDWSRERSIYRIWKNESITNIYIGRRALWNETTEKRKVMNVTVKFQQLSDILLHIVLLLLSSSKFD